MIARLDPGEPAAGRVKLDHDQRVCTGLVIPDTDSPAEYKFLMILLEHRGAGQRRDLCRDLTGELVEYRPMRSHPFSEPAKDSMIPPRQEREGGIRRHVRETQ